MLLGFVNKKKAIFFDKAFYAILLGVKG